MKIVSERITLDTSGNGDFLDITDQVAGSLARSGLRAGYVLVFVAGWTAGITTFEYEPGLVADLKEFLQRMAPTLKHYHHDDTWGDANGFSHVRASFHPPLAHRAFREVKAAPGHVATNRACGIRQ